MYGCGIGPIDNERDRRWSASVMEKHVDVITLRDPDSIKLLKELNVTKPELILAADPVLNISSKPRAEAEAFLERCGIDPEGSYLCVSLRPWPGLADKLGYIAQALRYCHEKYGLTPLLMPMNYEKDLAVSQMAAEAANVPFAVLPYIEDAELAIAVMKKMKFVTAMRLHSLLYAACGAAPSVGISYDPKVSGFADYIGGCSIDLYSVTADSLKECIDSALGGSDTEARHKKLECAKAKEQLNIAAAKRLLES